MLEYRRRCNALLTRGARPGIVTALLLAFDRGLLERVEALPDRRLAALRWR